MNNKAYEKVANGGNLNNIFENMEKLDIFENYLIHVETVDGAENNFINSMKNGHREVTDLYVSNDNMTSIKMI